jgi:rRNA maturation protein Rpf1
MLLVTTSRKPCRNNRVFARNLSNLVPGAVYEPRGKKSIDDLIGTARHKGLRRITIITDMKGNPGRMEFIQLDRRDWSWCETILRIKSIDFTPSKAKVAALSVAGPFKETVIDLFDLSESQEPELTLQAGKEEMRFDSRMNIKFDAYKKSEE